MNLWFSLFMLLAPIKTESGQFTIYQDGKKIGTEEFSVSQRSGGYLALGHTQVSVDNQTFDLRSRMELDQQLKTTFYEFQSKGNIVRLKVGKPVSELEYTLDGKIQPHDVNFPADGAILDDNFFHHYLILLYRAGAQETTIATFVPQQMTLGAVTIRPTGNRTFEIETSNVKLVATTDPDGRLVRIAVPGAKVVVER
ncbi:MAG: hypothetical protein DMG12_20330 [Acidobacteria bacterium]|nr:MAG: hypothetical protein DMG12_20330 [Acidobacteriota bacterium]